MIAQLPRLTRLPSSLPMEGVARLELQEGIPIFKASFLIHDRIDNLLIKQRESELTKGEADELNLYEELDDYLSLANRVIRNMIISQGIQYAGAK